MTIASIAQANKKTQETTAELELRFQLPPMEALSTAPAGVTHVPIEFIHVARNGHGEPVDLDGLVESIQLHGILEPLVVTPDGRLLAGRRRLGAARRAGLTVVPVTICEVADERTAIEVGLVENVHRADLDPLTRGQAYRELTEHGATVEQIARLVGEETGHVYQHLALLELHAEVQHALQLRSISFADARTLAPLPADDQAAVLNEIRNSPKSLSSRQVKAKVDARRVMRLVQNADTSGNRQQQGGKELRGNYSALFETEDATGPRPAQQEEIPPLDQLNAVISEIVAAAQGEDQLRAWARRLSRILERLRESNPGSSKCGKCMGRAQDRLL